VDQQVDSRTGASLLTQIVYCRNCAEAMRIIAHTQDPRSQKTALQIARHYDRAAELLQQLNARFGQTRH